VPSALGIILSLLLNIKQGYEMTLSALRWNFWTQPNCCKIL